MQTCNLCSYIKSNPPCHSTHFFKIYEYLPICCTDVGFGKIESGVLRCHPHVRAIIVKLLKKCYALMIQSTLPKISS